MDLTTFNSDVATMSSREISELCEKRHDHVIVDVEKLFDFYKEVYPPEKSGQLIHRGSYKDASGKSNKQYLLNKDAVIDLITGYSLPHRHAVNQRWQELEAAQPKHLPGSYRDAIAALLVEIDAKETALRTKAEIGCRREATAMNTASQATKKATALEIQLDRSKEYATVKRMEMSYHGTKFNWRLLKSTCKEMDIAPIDVFDSNYGTVKAYHADVWMETYAVTIIDA